VLREWPRLRGWLEEDAEGRVSASPSPPPPVTGRSAAAITPTLYRGARLALALEWRAAHEPRAQITTEPRLHSYASRARRGARKRRLRVVLRRGGRPLGVAVAAGLRSLCTPTRHGPCPSPGGPRPGARGLQALSEPETTQRALSLLLAKRQADGGLTTTVATRRNLLAPHWFAARAANRDHCPRHRHPLRTPSICHRTGRTLAVAWTRMDRRRSSTR
jgi:hypothetical protein